MKKNYKLLVTSKEEKTAILDHAEAIGYETNNSTIRELTRDEISLHFYIEGSIQWDYSRRLFGNFQIIQGVGTLEIISPLQFLTIKEVGGAYFTPDYTKLNLTPKSLPIIKERTRVVLEDGKTGIVVAYNPRDNDYSVRMDVVDPTLVNGEFNRACLFDSRDFFEYRSDVDYYDVSLVSTIIGPEPYPEPIVKELTLEEIAKKFNVSVDTIRIKD